MMEDARKFNERMINEHCDLRYKHKIYYAHNLQFDAKVALAIKPPGMKIICKLKSLKKWLRLEFYMDDKLIFEWRDSLNLLYGLPLQHLSHSMINMKNEKYGVKEHWLNHVKSSLTIPDKYLEECNYNPHVYKNKIIGLDWIKPEHEEFKKELIEYAKNDVICLWMVVYIYYNIFLYEFNFYIDSYYTTPSISWALYKSQYLEEGEIFKPKKQECEYIRSSYRGGLTEVFTPQWECDKEVISKEFKNIEWADNSQSNTKTSDLCRKIYIANVGDPKTEEELNIAKKTSHKVFVQQLINPSNKSVKIFKENLDTKIGIHADIVSSYPHSCIIDKQCGGRPRKLTQELTEEENYKLDNNQKLRPGFYTISWTSPYNIEFPTLGNLYNDSFTTAVGERHGVYSTINIQFAKKNGYKIKIIDGIYFETEEIPSLKRFINDLYKIKASEDKDSALRTASKLILNGFYGYTALKPRKYKEYVIPADLENEEYYKKKGFEEYITVGNDKMLIKEKQESNKKVVSNVYEKLLGKEKAPIAYNDRSTNEVAPQIGVFIVDYARCNLLDGIIEAKRCGLENLYSDTDSVYLGGDVRSALKWILKYNIKNDGKLGSWELEPCFDFM